MLEKKSVTREIAKRYHKSAKKEKSLMLKEYVKITGYNYYYASHLLNNQENIQNAHKAKKKIAKTKIYDEKTITALADIWIICDCICGKRLAPLLQEIIPVLEKFNEISLDTGTRKKLFSISPATIDRCLKKIKIKYQIKGRSKTKPGTLLKSQIPIRTYSQWDDAKPGFAEMDLVSHDGGSLYGDVIQSLNFTDVCVCWNEARAVKNKAQKWVFEALEDIRKNLPFDLRGLDSDNGSEFINDHLLRYCKKEKITFTRSRPYRKNDNCFVEQKNYSIIRRFAGYTRYDTQEELILLNKLYKVMNLYVNFFQPSMKLLNKTRIGSKVKKSYDSPKTPYNRVLDSPDIPQEKKYKLRKTYNKLNPAQLKRQINSIQEELSKAVAIKERQRLNQMKLLAIKKQK